MLSLPQDRPQRAYWELSKVINLYFFFDYLVSYLRVTSLCVFKNKDNQIFYLDLFQIIVVSDLLNSQPATFIKLFLNIFVSSHTFAINIVY